jgi:hypothetical protein
MKFYNNKIPYFTVPNVLTNLIILNFDILNNLFYSVISYKFHITSSILL